MKEFPQEWDILVAEELKRLGMPTRLNGFRYAKLAIMMTIDDPEVVCSVTKLLYPDIAKYYAKKDNDPKITPSRVERALRNAIEVSWNYGDADLFDVIFGYNGTNVFDENCTNRPTNSEYVANVAFYMNWEYHLNTNKQQDSSES